MLPLAAAVWLTACNRSSGPSGDSSVAPSSLGEPVAGDVPLVCTQCLKDEKYVGQTVTIEGEVFQQCPAKGCWFRIKDESGEAFIDLAPADLTVQGERVGQHAKVTGTVVKKARQMRLEAKHVEFSPLTQDAASGAK